VFLLDKQGYISFICIFLSLLCISAFLWSILEILVCVNMMSLLSHVTIPLWCLQYCRARSYLGGDYLVHLFLHRRYNFLQGPAIYANTHMYLVILLFFYLQCNLVLLYISILISDSPVCTTQSSIIFTDGLPWRGKFYVCHPLLACFYEIIKTVEILCVGNYLRNYYLTTVQQQQQLSHLSQVFRVGYMNQKRIMPDQAHGSAFSTHSYRAICLH